MGNFAIYDSGAGGLTLLKKLYFSIPADYIYFADTEKFPYGAKKQSELLEIVEKIFYI